MLQRCSHARYYLPLKRDSFLPPTNSPLRQPWWTGVRFKWAVFILLVNTIIEFVILIDRHPPTKPSSSHSPFLLLSFCSTLYSRKLFLPYLFNWYRLAALIPKRISGFAYFTSYLHIEPEIVISHVLMSCLLSISILQDTIFVFLSFLLVLPHYCPSFQLHYYNCTLFYSTQPHKIGYKMCQKILQRPLWKSKSPW